MEVVLDQMVERDLPAQAARIGAHIQETCCVGPVRSIHGAGLLLGLRTEPPAREVCAALRERGILTGTAADPHVLRLLPPLILEEQHVEQLRDALLDLPRNLSR